jgi:hypothetical protein
MQGGATQACCWMEDPRRLEPTAIPEEIAAGLARYHADAT